MLCDPTRVSRLFSINSCRLETCLNVSWYILYRTFRFDYLYHFLACELVKLTTRSSAVLVYVVNSRRFDPKMILQTLGTIWIVLTLKRRTCSRSRPRKN